MPLKLTDLQMANKTIERKFSIKFLEVMLDENSTWKDHIHTIEKKIAKNLSLLYRARNLLKSFISHIFILI